MKKKINPVPKYIPPDFYEPEPKTMHEKIRKVINLIEEAKTLLVESGSGGKHDTSCFADGLRDYLCVEYDKAYTSLEATERSVRKINVAFNKEEAFESDTD